MGSFQGDFPSLVFLSIQYLRGMSGAGKRCQPNREVDAPVMSPRGKRRRHNPALVWEHSPTTHSSGSESRERPPLGSSARTATRLALLARLAAAPVVVSLRHTAAAERKERVKKEKKSTEPASSAQSLRAPPPREVPRAGLNPCAPVVVVPLTHPLLRSPPLATRPARLVQQPATLLLAATTRLIPPFTVTPRASIFCSSVVRARTLAPGVGKLYAAPRDLRLGQ